MDEQISALKIAGSTVRLGHSRLITSLINAFYEFDIVSKHGDVWKGEHARRLRTVELIMGSICATLCLIGYHYMGYWGFVIINFMCVPTYCLIMTEYIRRYLLKVY